MLLKTPGFVTRLLLKTFRNKRYAELEKFKSEVFYETGLENYLRNFQKPGVRHGLNLKNFSLRYSYGLYRNDFEYIYCDAPYTLVLTYKENCESETEEVACIGFDVVDQATILVKQIQGVYGKSSILQYFRWERMLLKIVVDWAKNAGFKRIRVIKSESSHWFTESRAQSFFMKYDVTARRSGFKFDEKDQTYVRTLA